MMQLVEFKVLIMADDAELIRAEAEELGCLPEELGGLWLAARCIEHRAIDLQRVDEFRDELL